ncbi:hypothetical protein FNV43_RR02311 [Rhamnella rubrinervis]|uniref:F-box domain-containing protein n=1 Tax=Rhamnella rubrinervis TaxID=2594499 RepID=A0A8K0HSW5_9ROSA|nr:hypothetical protein FNV43_RR02311 [Rhamnella rubrinervis]
MDACRLSLVCRLFRSAADSDAVWGRFFPHDLLQILSGTDFASSMDSLSKKELFFRLSHRPVLVGDDRNRSFAIDKRNGKKCYMLGARRLSISWGDTPAYWRWIPDWQQSRFLEVAELRIVWWLDIKGWIETNMLSPKTRYAAYFVYNLNVEYKGFEERPVKLRVYLEGQDGNGDETSVFLKPPPNMQQQFRERGDGWMEVEMGEFFNDGGEEDDHRCMTVVGRRDMEQKWTIIFFDLLCMSLFIRGKTKARSILCHPIMNI